MPVVTPSMVKVEVETTPVGLLNVIRNPSGQRGAWGWNTPVSNTKMTANGTALTLVTTPSQATYAYTEAYAVAAGQYAAGRIDLTAITASHYARVRIEWLDASKAFLSAAAQSASANAGTLYAAPVVAPASTAYYRLRVDLYKGTLTGNPDANAAVSWNRSMLTYAATLGGIVTIRTNLALNPSLETNTTSWTGATRTAATAYAGTYCAALASGNGTLAGAPVTPGTDYTVSAYMKGTAKGSLQLGWYSSGGTLLVPVLGAPVALNTSTWTRVSITANAPGGAATLRAVSQSSDGTAINVDGVLVEAGTTLGAYFDGSSTAAGKTYAWTGTAHGSTSTETGGSTFDYAENAAWLDITAKTTSASIDTSQLDPGLLSVVSIDKALDPAYSSTLATGKRIRVSGWDGASWAQAYEGVITGVPVTYTESKDPAQRKFSFITIAAANNVTALAGIPQPKGVGTVAELPYLLEGAGVPWSCGSAGGNQVTAATIVANQPDAYLLDQVAITRDSDAAYAWVDRYNVLNVVRRTSMPTTPVVTFSDVAGAAYSYSDIDVGRDPAAVIDSVTITWLRYKAKKKTVTEVTYGPYVAAGTLGQHTAEFTLQGNVAVSAEASTCATFAATILAANATPTVHANSLTVPVASDSVRAMACALSLYDVVRITYSDKLANADARVTSIHHDITPTGWVMELA